MRAALSAFALCLLAAPALAENHDHDHADHVAEAEGLRVIHAWAAATPRGDAALVYMDIENATGSEVVLTGGEALGQPLDLVGFGYGATGETWTVLPALPLGPGQKLMLAPKVLALRLSDLPQPLEDGSDLDLEVQFGDLHLEAHVEIGAADATAHSHAGHMH